MILQWLRSLEIDHLTHPLPYGGRWAHNALVILVMVDDACFHVFLCGFFLSTGMFLRN
jgi:hypothetical protein